MKAKRIKRKTVQFTVKVDEEILLAANQVRSETWVSIVEAMLLAMVVDGKKSG